MAKLDGRNANGTEPWTTFRDRVLNGLRRIQEGPSNRRVVLFTSGGPIGVLVQTALGAPDRSFLEVNWRVRNCSSPNSSSAADACRWIRLTRSPTCLMNGSGRFVRHHVHHNSRLPPPANDTRAP